MVDEIIDTGALKKAVAKCTKHKAPRGLNKKKTRNTGVTNRPTDIATGGKSEKTGNANRDMASSVQNDGPHLSSEAIELATTHRESQDKDTLHRMTARVRRPIQAIISSLEQEQEVVRKTRYASEEPSKRRRLSGKDIDCPDRLKMQKQRLELEWLRQAAATVV